ncbi:MAG: TCP-1/cpn60 chaperonin family protein, partial [candidate division WOR-3 bacterium]
MKVKQAIKQVVYSPDILEKAILQTTSLAADVVGSTLGPHGKVVLIERQENLPPYTTKDGITVFNSIGLSDSISQVVLEALRDSSSKTNIEAGDGTTTATILAHSIVKEGLRVRKENPSISVQQIVRELELLYRDVIQPFITDNAIKVPIKNYESAKEMLKKVALISTNSDQEMADAVLKCFDLVGHNGHVNIVESAGTSGYEVEKIEGFPIGRGFEESCGRYLEEFINDKANYRIVLTKPRFILYNGKINDLSTLMPAIEKLSAAFEESIQKGDNTFSPNIVLVAHHFSDEVLAALAYNFKNPSTLNIVPLKTPMTIQSNSPYHFLLDLAAFTGAGLFDPLSKPLTSFDLQCLGVPTMENFECYRYRSVLLGEPDEMILQLRAEELQMQANNAASSLDAELTKERLGILVGGIARLKIRGSSEAELKEKKHRVEDAVLAIKGAIKWGILPGCSKTLLYLSYLCSSLKEKSKYRYASQILTKSFLAPFFKILKNGGYNDNYINKLLNELMYEPQTF